LNDGDTHVTFGPASESIKAGQPDFDGILNTANKEIILFDALEPQFAIAQVPSEKTRIRIWMNHPTSPDQVTIAWGVNKAGTVKKCGLLRNGNSQDRLSSKSGF